VPGTAGATETIAAGTAFAWNPTVRGAKSEDTFIAGGHGAAAVTNTADWPVVADGRPAILPLS
jgi:Xaa-Pro dipeptidase